MKQLIKKFKLFSKEKIKILYTILITLFITYLISILDPFDLDFFNEKYISDLESELSDLKQHKEIINDNHLSTTKEISSEVNTKTKIIYYLVGGVVLVGILFFCFNGGSGDLGIMDDINNYLPDEDLNPDTFNRLFSETSSTVRPSSTPDVEFIKL